MGNKTSAGKAFRQAIAEEQPLQVVGTINAFSALMAKRAGFRAIYLSGSGVAGASYGLPDLGIITLDNVLDDTRRVTDAVDLPLLVDIDTGFGGTEFSITRTIQTLEKAGAAALHMEDQVLQKRCGHRPGKEIVSREEMSDRIGAAVDARSDPEFMIIARTDAFASEGLKGALERSKAYVDTGADAIFAEALTTVEEYETFTKELSAPVLANLTEFGKTPLFSLEEMRKAGVAIVLYPLSAFRAMNKAAEETYRTIRGEGSQSSFLDSMQTREEYYDLLDYYAYESTAGRLQKGEQE